MRRFSFIVVTGLLACGSSAPGDLPEPVAAVRISPDSSIIHPGDDVRHVVHTTDSRGNELEANVSWQVLETAVAQVAAGLARTKSVTAVSPGRTMVIVSVDAVSDTALLEVLNPVDTVPPGSCVRRLYVSAFFGLSAAVSAAPPGDCIVVAAGVYELGTPSWSQNGTVDQPITLEGTGSATVFDLGGNGGIYLRASHWRLRKLRITNGFFGVQTEGSDDVELDSVEIDHTRQSAVNLRYGTHNSSVQRSYIHDTGEETARYGEGVYIGGTVAPASMAVDEAADNNHVIDSRFGPNVRAEAVDIAAGADSVVMTGNTLDGTGTVSELGFMNSLIGVRGFGHQIDDNVLSKGAPDGIVVYAGSARFHRNRIALFNLWNYPTPVGIRQAGGTATISCDNVVTDIPPGGVGFDVPCVP
jgi:parallel beta helix pectate lyase-like protein/Big-like domain-containing protein